MSRRLNRERLMRRVTNASVATALTLALAKFLGFWLCGSVALLASAVDSALDSTASLLNALAVRYALKPADDDHRFGHGKSEALAGLAQAVLICASGVFIIQHAVDRLLHPRPLVAVALGIAIMTFAMLATLALVVYQRRVVRETGSLAIQADSLHYVSDLAANLGTIVALALARFGLGQFDPWLGIAIALGTLYGALTIGWQVFHVLMDRELPADVQERIRAIALGHAEVRGLHALRTRQSGPTLLIQFHLELDPSLTLVEANRIAHEVSDLLEEVFPGADVLIHQDAAGTAFEAHL
jgi:ferrous-iron efflux pump FieF